MIVSFAHTTAALLAGRKTVTRREWNDDYAAKFKPGMLVDAWDRSPRTRRGKKVATIRIVNVRKESLARMIEDVEYGRAEVEKEGALWKDAVEFASLFRAVYIDIWRIEFEVISKV